MENMSRCQKGARAASSAAGRSLLPGEVRDGGQLLPP